MFLLMSLIHICLRCVFVPLFGTGRPLMTTPWAATSYAFIHSFATTPDPRSPPRAYTGT